jgi:hypothetical protein
LSSAVSTCTGAIVNFPDSPAIGGRLSKHEEVRMTRGRSLSTFMMFALSACARSEGTGQPAPPPPVLREGDQISVTGPITPAVAAEFSRQAGVGVKTLVINSGGGDSRSAVEMGRIVHKLGLQVIVRKACMSGCAHFIFAAARARQVEPDSLVVFHNTRSSIARLGAPLRSPATESMQRGAEADAELERAFYKEIGVPESFLYQPQIEIQTQCVQFARDGAGNVRDLEFSRIYAGWIPRRVFMKNVNLPVEGFWPEDVPTLKQAFLKVFAPGAPIYILIGGGERPDPMAQLQAAFAKIGLCESVPKP